MQEYKGYSARKHTLVATLGGKPQIVTFTLDLLLQRGIPISEVIILHPAASPRIQQSLERLAAEFAGNHYSFEGRSLPMLFRQQVLFHYDSAVDDIIDEPTASGALDTIGELIRSLKRQQRIIHFSISSGRRLMGFLSFSAALLYFETPDQLLHLYSPEHVKERTDKSGAMHITAGDGRKLIEVPFARAAQPLLAMMLNHSPSATIQTQREQQKAEELKRCQQVMNALKDRPQEILRAIAQGLHPDEVADTLGIKASTVNFHTSKIYQECRNIWDVPENIRLDYRFVQAKFADYFNDK
jgi:CRISPR-associated protein Csx14